MAETGLSLVVSKEMLANLQKADNAITNLATTSEQAKNRIIAAFTEMGQKGVGAFINQLNEAQSMIANFNGMKVQGLDFSQFTDSTTKAIDNVNQLATTITKFETISTRSQNNSKGGLNLFTRDNTIKAFEEKLDSLWKKLDDTSMKLLGLKREWYSQGASRSGFGEDIKNTTQEADKLMSQIQRMQTFLNGIKGQSAEAFGAMIKSMHQSDFELVQLNQSLRDGNSLLQRQTELWQQSYQAKEKSNKSKSNYDEQMRAYEQMFDKIIARENEQVRVANENAKQRTEQAKQGYAAQLRAWEEMFDKIRQKEQKQDLDAYNAWLKQKDKERQVNEQIEDEKYKRQKDNAYKAYREEQERQSRLLEEYRKQNERARDSVTTAPEAYRQTLKMYVQMFDEIDKKRQADILKASQAYDKIAQQVKQRILEEERAAEQEALANKRKAEQVIKNYQDEVKAARKAYAERQRMYEELFAQQAKEQSKARRDNYERYISSYDGAMRLSGKANTLSKEERAIKALEQARANLSKTDSQYEQKLRNLNNAILKHRQNIDSATTGSKNLQDSHKGLMNISEQLQRRLALVFSVSQITGYINKLISVRGEFELQQRSLEAILQNKDEADKLWQQTIDLAVKSPFRVKELVTYTKQLAAYRVETEKLHDTTKMLSDVSAGLGVDMQRLILAFGQVKAANYLRGTELRQFSEAGINILGELAKYFSEVEGIAVSVGDVFERVSKRMVSFADVEEIFKRLTSEGGTFYRMQEIQSETLKGQISNLKDSIDIMLNDIGKSNENTLKGFVSLFKSLVDNWRVISATILPILEAMILRWGVFKVMTLNNSKAIIGFTSVFKTFGRHFGIVITQLTRGTRVAKAFTAATGVSIMSGWATVILAVVAALGVLIKTIQNANRVKKELEKLEISGVFDASRSIAEYKRLAEVVSDTSKTYDEQQKALIELKNKYDGILPSQLLEEKTIKSLRGNYQDATNAIYEYIAAKTKEKQIGVIQSEYGEDVEEQANDLADRIKGALSKVAPQITKTDVLPIIDKFRELIQSGEIGKTQGIDSVLKQLIKEYTGLEVSSTAWIETMAVGQGELIETGNKANDLVVAIKKMDSAIREVTNSSLEWHQSFAYQDFNKIKEGYQAQSNAIGKYYEIIRKYKDASELKAQGKGTISKQLERDYKFAINELNKIFTEAKQQTPNWNNIVNEPFKLNEATINANKILWQKMITEINNMPIDESKKGARANFVELLEEDIKKLKGTAKQQEVKRVAKGLAESMEVSLEGLDELFLKSNESLTEYAERVSSTLEVYKQNILQFDTDVKNKTNFGYYTKEQVDLMKEQVPFLEEYLKFFAAFLKQQKKGAEVDTFTPKLKAVKEIYDAYKKLKNTFDDVTAQEGALAKFGDTFKEAFGKTPEEMGFDLFSEEGVKKAYDYLIKKAPDAKKKIQAELAKGEIVWDVRINKKELEDKALLDQIEEMFSGYELSIELQKLNIPNDLAKQLFDVDAITLPELKLKVESLKSQFEGKDMLDEWDKLMKRINEMEAKAQQERLKTYSQYLVKAQSERVKIKLEELRKIAEVEKESAFTDTQRQEILEALRNETQKKLDKLTWDEFKDSDLYLKVFEDLEYVSDVTLTSVKDKLDLIKSSLNNLSVEDLRIITKEMQKIEGELMQRSPFKTLISNLKDYIHFLKERNEIEQKWKESQKKEDALKAQADDRQIRIAQLQQEYETSVKTKGVLSEESIAIKRKLDFEKQILNNTLKQLVAQGKITQEYAAQLKKGEKSKKGVVVGLKGAMNEINEGYNAFNGLMDTIQSMFGEFGEGFQSFLDGVSGVVDGLGTIEGGLSQILDGKIFSGIFNTITGVFKSIGAIFGIGLGDKRKQRKIEKETELVEGLQKQYEKLDKTIDKAYTISTLEINQKAISKNIDAQIRSYEKMIKLEDDKKNTDKKKIKEWEDTIEELREKRKELNDEILSGLGGVTEQEYRSATRAFIDAWTNAFQETGNGLDGLQQHFADFFNNILAEQATLHVAQKMLAPFYRQVESALNDSRLSSNEAKALKDKFTEIAPQINDFLSSFFENIGGFVDGSKYELSGLQRGIQGITEDQADVIASYLNSMRFFVADSNTKLSLLVDSFTNPESANPMLSELRSQSEMIRAIRDMFSSVIGRGSSTHTGAFLKVAL